MIRIGLLLGLAATIAAPSAAQNVRSTGVYRVPYANGTEVRVNRDHLTHTPVGRIDMGGRGGSNYRIVAAAPGTIRFIEDSFSERQNSDTAAQCNNNYVWIAHANGEWTKYSHMRRNSTRGDAGRKVGDTVRAGDFLGIESDVGCAGGDHLHFEVGVPRATNPITTVGGFLQDNAGSTRNRVPRICGHDIFVAGRDYEAKATPGPFTPGGAEIARHGLPIGDMQCLFDMASAGGYEPVSRDFFTNGGDVFANPIFRPAGGGASRARFGLDGAAYQAAFNTNKADGYRLKQVESYRQGGETRYAAIWKKDTGPEQAAYHGLSAAQHQARIDDWTAKGFRPINISVVMEGGERRYTALYEKANVGSWQAKSSLTPAEYQALWTENDKKGRQVVYLNGYSDDGPRIVAIWHGKTAAPQKARHGMTGAAYQTEWESARKAGMLTRSVTAYPDGGGIRYAAVWRK